MHHIFDILETNISHSVFLSIRSKTLQKGNKKSYKCMKILALC